MNKEYRHIGEYYRISSSGDIETRSPKGRSKELTGWRPKGTFRNNKNGYIQVGLKTKDGTKTLYVHRLVVSAFLGEIPAGMDVNHKDGVKTNNSLQNLEIVSRKENISHAVSMGVFGTLKSRSDGGNSYITPSRFDDCECLTILTMLDVGLGAQPISKYYKASRNVIQQLRHGKGAYEPYDGLISGERISENQFDQPLHILGLTPKTKSK